MTTISPELVERMVKLVRALAPEFSSEWNAELHAIAALLPAPVDPDLILAREIICGLFSKDSLTERLVMAGIKRGRELANDGWIVWRGGECPVAPRTSVTLLLRDGEEVTRDDAQFSNWGHGEQCKYDRQIIAYRIVKRADGGV